MSNLQITISADLKEVIINGKTYILKEEVKEWEIVIFKGIGNNREWRLTEIGDYCEYNNLYTFSLEWMIEFVKTGTVYIESVRRLTDNEVFSVGDNEKHIGKITRIAVSVDGIILPDLPIYLFSDEGNWVKLNFAEKQTVLK